MFYISYIPIVIFTWNLNSRSSTTLSEQMPRLPKQRITHSAQSLPDIKTVIKGMVHVMFCVSFCAQPETKHYSVSTGNPVN